MQIPLAKPVPRSPAVDWSHPLSQGLRHAWLFNQGAGSVVPDVVGGSHGTLTDMDPKTDWVGSLHGGAIDFDGTGDRVLLDTTPVMPDALTWVVLAKFTSSGNFPMLIANGNQQQELRFNAGSRSLQLNYTAVITGTIVTPLNTWAVFIVTHRAGAQALYVDGVLDGTDTQAYVPPAEAYAFGARPDATFLFTGEFGFVGMWDRAFSALESYEISQDVFAPFREPDPVELWDVAAGAPTDNLDWKLAGGRPALAGSGGLIA